MEIEASRRGGSEGVLSRARVQGGTKNGSIDFPANLTPRATTSRVAKEAAVPGQRPSQHRAGTQFWSRRREESPRGFGGKLSGLLRGALGRQGGCFSAGGDTWNRTAILGPASGEPTPRCHSREMVAHVVGPLNLPGQKATLHLDFLSNEIENLQRLKLALYQASCYWDPRRPR